MLWRGEKMPKMPALLIAAVLAVAVVTPSRAQTPEVGAEPAGLVRLIGASSNNFPPVSDLTACFSIKRCFIEYKFDTISIFEIYVCFS